MIWVPRDHARCSSGVFYGTAVLRSESAIMNAQVQEQPEKHAMQTIKDIHWQQEESWLGYLEEYSNSWSQGDALSY